MEESTIAHSLVAAHAERVQEFARLYGELARAVTEKGPRSEPAGAAHRALGQRIAAWERADHEAELRDVVTLSTEERAALLADTKRAIGHAESNAQGLAPGARERGVVDSLTRLHADFPTTLTRAALVRAKRSAARLNRIEALRGPAFLLGGEAEVLLGAIESATASLVPPAIEADPEEGFRSMLARGLRACVVLAPGAAGAADLGLGVSKAVAAVLGVAGKDLQALTQRWERSPADPSHPFARYPFVPNGRFGGGGAPAVRGDLESTGPIGWATASDAGNIARDLRAATSEHRALASELGAAADRVEAAVARGHALIGWIEYLTAEEEGQRKWLVDPETDGG